MNSKLTEPALEEGLIEESAVESITDLSESRGMTDPKWDRLWGRGGRVFTAFREGGVPFLHEPAKVENACKLCSECFRKRLSSKVEGAYRYVVAIRSFPLRVLLLVWFDSFFLAA